MAESRRIQLSSHSNSLVICERCANTVIFDECGFCLEMERVTQKTIENKFSFWKEVNRFALGLMIFFVATALFMALAHLL